MTPRPPARPPVTEYLTEDKGFEWRRQPTRAGESERFTDGPSGDDERMLEESPAVLVFQRGRGDVRCTVQAASRSTERHGGVDVAKTVERARERAESPDPLPRRPRRRPARRGRSEKERPAGPSPTQRLLEQIREDGVGRDLRVEVMEKSGLRGNEVRDFNPADGAGPARSRAPEPRRAGGAAAFRARHGALAGDGHPCGCVHGERAAAHERGAAARAAGERQGAGGGLGPCRVAARRGDRQRTGRRAARGVDGGAPVRLRAGVPAGAQRP